MLALLVPLLLLQTQSTPRINVVGVPCNATDVTDVTETGRAVELMAMGLRNQCGINNYRNKAYLLVHVTSPSTTALGPFTSIRQAQTVV
jgi:hypothetical protein